MQNVKLIMIYHTNAFNCFLCKAERENAQNNKVQFMRNKFPIFSQRAENKEK